MTPAKKRKQYQLLVLVSYPSLLLLAVMRACRYLLISFCLTPSIGDDLHYSTRLG